MIDEKKLIEELEEQYKNLIPEDDWDYCKIRQIKADIKVVNRQPTIQPQGIDKDRLIEELDKERYKFITDDLELEWNRALWRATEIINQQPQTGWIPVSSGKLPTKEDYSEDGFVLVQTDGDIIYKGLYDVENGFWVDEMGFKFAYLPIAWQPLPQPYKECE